MSSLERKTKDQLIGIIGSLQRQLDEKDAEIKAQEPYVELGREAADVMETKQWVKDCQRDLDNQLLRRDLEAERRITEVLSKVLLGKEANDEQAH